MRLWPVPVLACLLVTAASADHDLGVYWFNDVLVADQFVPGGHEIRVIRMTDAEDLRIAATVLVEQDFSFDGYAHWGNYLLVVIRNRIEVFDFSEPSRPSKVRVLALHADEGGGRGTIGMGVADSTLIALTYCCTGAVELSDDVSSWTVVPSERRPSWPEPPVDYSFPPRSNTTVRTTQAFAYELVWVPYRTPTGTTWRELFLQKRHVRGRALSSTIFLGANLETIGE